MKEIWRQIENYPMYEVSNFGRVRNNVTNNVLTVNYNHGYGQVCFTRKHLGFKTPKTYRVHQLVARAFLQHIPDGFRVVVDHIDRDVRNNRVDNLQLISQRDNVTRNRKDAGVYQRSDNKRWRATIWIDGKNINLGCFDKKTEALAAYRKAIPS